MIHRATHSIQCGVEEDTDEHWAKTAACYFIISRSGVKTHRSSTFGGPDGGADGLVDIARVWARTRKGRRRITSRRFRDGL